MSPEFVFESRERVVSVNAGAGGEINQSSRSPLWSTQCVAVECSESRRNEREVRQGRGVECARSID
jgi:hypothetical protein